MTRRLFILAWLLVAPAAANAYQWRADTNTLVLPADGRFEEETLWAANKLDIQGKAGRDLWLLAAHSVRFDGESAGDLRVLAGTAVLGGDIRQNLLAYAKGLQLTTNATVRGEAALFGAAVICEGAVEGDAWIVAKSVTLGGRWGGRVRIHADEIRIAPDTQIAGDLVYTSPKPLAYDASVSIGGDVVQTAALPKAPLRARMVLHGYLFLAALLAGMPFVGFFPDLAGGAVRRLRLSPWRVLAAGALTVLFGPFLIAFAAMTIVGLPLALLLGALYGALAYLSHIVIALWLGHRLLRATGPQTFARVLSSLATGLFLLYFAAALPGVASFIALPVLVLGSGALALAFLQRPAFPFPVPPPPGPPPLPKNPEPPETTE
ncbi:MAG TPA: hypothetical protein DCM68_01920 [Verrucomicrobia bacterium]|nr:hypothetical protein [Verrucomicrobiota bacterium]